MSIVDLAQSACAHLEIPLKDRTISDYQAFFDCLSDDIVFMYSSPSGLGEVHGKRATVEYIRESFKALGSDNQDIRLVTPLTYLSKEQCVVALWTEADVNATSDETAQESREVVVVMYFHNGLLKRLSRFSQ